MAIVTGQGIISTSKQNPTISRIWEQVRNNPTLPTKPRIETPETREYMRRANLAFKRSHTGLGEYEYNKYNFDTLDRSCIDQNKLQYCLDWNPQSYSKGILLSGNCGTAKTHIACALLIKHCHRGFTGKFYSLSQLMADIKSRFSCNDNRTSNAQILNDIYTCGLLVVDDIGDSRTSEYDYETFSQIINARMRQGLKIIITTNLGSQKLSEIYGDRIPDRLNECVKPILFTGESYRKTHLYKLR